MLLRYFIKFSIGLVVVSLAGLAVLSPTAYADDCQDKFNSLTDEQREMFNIANDEWKPATATLPAHAFIVGCHDCAGATYDATGLLTNSVDLHKIPTSWIMKVPKICNGRGVVIIPPGVFNQVEAFTTFSGAISALMNEGYTIASMNHPNPGYPGFPYDSFIEPPYHAHDLRNAYLGTGHLLRDLMTEVFGAPVGFYALSQSRGTHSGTGLLASETGSPFDGYAMGTGGNGFFPNLMSFIETYQTVPNRIPLTGIPPLETTSTQKLANLFGVNGVGLVDPEYHAFVFNGATVEEQLARALAYNVAERPGKVQRAWADREFDPEIKKPTIIYQGLRDRSLIPGGAITYSTRIVDIGKSSLHRIYLVRDMGHAPVDPPAPPPSLQADAIRKLDAWVQNGTEPGSLNASQFGFQPSCATLGFGQDPLRCFCNVLDIGIGGFCSDDSNTACMTDNPTTPANEDNCVPAAKGMCDAVIPEVCGT